MGVRGPVPKREAQRKGHAHVARDAQAAEPVARPAAGARVSVPAAPASWHPTARRMFRSLKGSGQAAFYQQSDWALAFLAAELTSGVLSSPRPSAQMMAVADGMWSRLLVSEGDRRRLRVEIDTGAGDPEAEAASAAVLSLVASFTS